MLQPSWQVPARRTLAGRGAWMIPLNRMVGASIDREPVRDASRIKLDFERVQFREERDQIVQAAPEAIDRMDEAIGWLSWLDREERRLV